MHVSLNWTIENHLDQSLYITIQTYDWSSKNINYNVLIISSGWPTSILFILGCHGQFQSFIRISFLYLIYIYFCKISTTMQFKDYATPQSHTSLMDKWGGSQSKNLSLYVNKLAIDTFAISFIPHEGFFIRKIRQASGPRIS